MKKLFTYVLVAASMAAGTGVAFAETTPFTIECNFDMAGEFPSGANVPEGWKLDGTNLTRNQGSYWGLGAAQSGDYVLGSSQSTSADVIYTPVMHLPAGVPCDLEFYVMNANNGMIASFYYDVTTSVCSAQNSGAVVAKNINTTSPKTAGQWTKVTVSYTPEADGDYCFAINGTCHMGDNFAGSYAKNLAYDSFIIEGSEVKPEPAGDPLDVTFNFDNDEDFPGVQTLPAGWTSNGVKPFRRYTAETLNLPAPPSGEYVLGNIGAACNRNNILATGFYNLVGGEEATFQFSYYAVNTIVTDGYGFEVYASPTQELGEGSVLIGTIPETLDREKKWYTSEVFRFTPAEKGKWCFIIVPFNETGYTPGGPVGFDDVKITGRTYDPALEPVIPDIVGTPEAFTIECDFDIDGDFASGANVPEGWKLDGTSFKRDKGSYWGIGAAKSGEYALGATSSKSTDVIYTPVVNLVAGRPCNLEFWVQNYGNGMISAFYYDVTASVHSAQSASALVETISTTPVQKAGEWTKIAVSYTPEADGDYCFAINAVCHNGDNFADSYAKTFAYDSFIIEGTRYGNSEPGPRPEIELEPNEDYLAECVELPYIEYFDGTNYDGSSYLPIGWSTTGTVTWRTSSHPSVPAVEGEYYMTVDHNPDGERDDIAYTPFFNLEAANTYTISFSVYMQGNNWNDDGITYTPTLDITVGTEHDSDFHNVIGTYSRAGDKWVPLSFSFTPKKSGAYCFAFNLTGPKNSGYVFVDDLKITADGLIARVEPAFMVKGLYSLMDYTKTVAFDGQALQMANKSRYADSYKWTAEGAEPSESTEAEPSFVFPADGSYTITLEAANGRGSRRTQRTIDVLHVGKLTQADQALTVYSSNQDRLYGRGETPAFDTDEYDFITGFNHYYFDLAQRFDLSGEIPATLKQLSLYITDRRFRGETSYFDDQRVRPMSIVVYGAKPDGSLDESNVLGRIDTTIGAALGSSGLGGSTTDPRSIEFETPITVTGTIYVAMHFDRSMEVVPQDATLGRSYIGQQTIRHGHGKTTLYVKPFDKPAGSLATLNEWTTVDALDSQYAGMGAYWTLWLNTYDEAAAVTAVDINGEAVFAATFFGDELCVSGTQAGEPVFVYSLDGKPVASAPATEGTTRIAMPASAKGVYVVRHGANSAKVAK